ncbi:MAG: c-type cytochrome [Burkholderiales bacterium]|nr:c-type cytochrome [Burkholderiales bacterium]
MNDLQRALRAIVFWAVLAAAGGALAQPAPAPAPGFFPNSAKGGRLYQEKCASCHGKDLRGTPQGPPQIHVYYVPNHHGDAAYQIAVRNGVRQHHWRFGDMPPVPGLTPEDVGHIIAFVRREQKKAGLDMNAAMRH